jgi:mono/diheme cytochrome c family protein
VARVVGLGLFAAVLGCSQSNSSPPVAKAAPVVAAAPTDGKGLFDQHCAKCHGSGGGAGARKGKAPDLSHAGTEHAADWIAEHIRNPKAHEPGSKMPAFEGKLQQTEIKTLADYLAAQK